MATRKYLPSDDPQKLQEQINSCKKRLISAHRNNHPEAMRYWSRRRNSLRKKLLAMKKSFLCPCGRIKSKDSEQCYWCRLEKLRLPRKFKNALNAACLLLLTLRLCASAVNLHAQANLSNIMPAGANAMVPPVNTNWVVVVTNGMTELFTNGVLAREFPTPTNSVCHYPQVYNHFVDCLTNGQINICQEWVARDFVSLSVQIGRGDWAASTNRTYTLWKSPNLKFWVYVDSATVGPGWYGGFPLVDQSCLTSNASYMVTGQ